MVSVSLMRLPTPLCEGKVVQVALSMSTWFVVGSNLETILLYIEKAETLELPRNNALPQLTSSLASSLSLPHLASEGRKQARRGLFDYVMWKLSSTNLGSLKAIVPGTWILGACPVVLILCVYTENMLSSLNYFSLDSDLFTACAFVFDSLLPLPESYSECHVPIWVLTSKQRHHVSVSPISHTLMSPQLILTFLSTPLSSSTAGTPVSNCLVLGSLMLTQ